MRPLDGLNFLWRSMIMEFPVLHPNSTKARKLDQVFAISCFLAAYVDPMVFFLRYVDPVGRCLVFNITSGAAIAVLVVLRTMIDFIYLSNMLLQFRVAYMALESTVVGAGNLVFQRKRIALHYVRGYFLRDLFAVLPIQQIIFTFVPGYLRSPASLPIRILQFTVLLQFILKAVIFLPILDVAFESARANYVTNIFKFIWAGHVVGSCWYFFGIQRVSRCFWDACRNSALPGCKYLTECRLQSVMLDGEKSRLAWIGDLRSESCLDASGGYKYGIFTQVVGLVTEGSIINRYIYSLVWGFQQISTLGGNLGPTYNAFEALFAMAVTVLGVFLLSLLVGQIQIFHQALGRRMLEMKVRRHDVEKWLNHRCLPEELRRKVREAEQFNWAVSQGVKEEELLENLPEDLQREIRRHFFEFLRKVKIFAAMEQPILDAIHAKLKLKIYMRGSDIFIEDGPLEKMIFIVRGEVGSIAALGNASPLSEEDVPGKELLAWYLEQFTVHEDGGNIRFPGPLFSSRTIRCLTDVEAFVLSGSDLQEVMLLYSRFLRKPDVQEAIRRESPHWRNLRDIAAATIQLQWRHRQRRLNVPT